MIASRYRTLVCCLIGMSVLPAATVKAACDPSSLSATLDPSARNLSLSWAPVDDTALYDVRLDDGSSDRFDDSHFQTCAPMPHYYCENAIEGSRISAPVQPGRVYHIWIETHAATTASACRWETVVAPQDPALKPHKPSRAWLVFSLDQGFGNGIIETRDEVALNRIVRSLKPFESRFEVAAIIQTRARDHTKTEWIMSALARNGLRFFVDAWTSDALTMGETAVTRPHDLRHGLASSFEALAAYKARWPEHFVGLRIHEAFSISWTILACKHRGERWCDTFRAGLPEDRYFDESRLEGLVALASRNRMPVLLSDPYWHALRRHDDSWNGRNIVRQEENEAALKRVLARHPDTVYVLYANNEGGDLQWQRRHIWPAVVAPFLADGAAGFGLSDQSWLCTGPMAEAKGWSDTNCPPDILTDMATKAFDEGASVVQLEPAWYFWQLPRGEIGVRTNYTRDPAWAERGSPRASLDALAKALGISDVTRQAPATMPPADKDR